MLALDRYRAFFAHPATPRPALASFLGRLPNGMMALSIVLLVRQETGAFAIAGLASACYAIAIAVSAPVAGRLIDRFGPVRVFRVNLVAYPLAIIALVAAAKLKLPAIALMTTAALVGATVPHMAAVSRSLWRRILDDDALRQTAYSMEAMLVESVHIMGPLLVALTVPLGTAAVPLLVGGLLCVVGASMFIRTPPLRDWHESVGQSREPRDWRGPLVVRPYVVLLVTTATFAVSLGIVQVCIPAYASGVGHPAVAGVLVAIWSAGSMAGGLVYGTRSWPKPLHAQYAWCNVGVGLAMVPLAFAPNLAMMLVALVASGLLLAPGGTAKSTLISRIVPGHLLTESFSWMASAFFSGNALGMAMGGYIIDHGGLRWAFLAAALVTLVGPMFLYAMRHEFITPKTA